MKILIFLFTIVVASLAYPTTIDWSNVKPKYAYLEPLPNVTSKTGPHTRISGGAEAEPNAYPYQVALIIDGTSLCGGSVISRNFVLSAAHCTIRGSYVIMIFGAHNILNAEPTQFIVASTSIVNHPQYNANSLVNDVSLIRIPTSLTLSNTIQVVPLAPDSSGDFTGDAGIFTGWGITANSNSSISPALNHITLTVLTNAVCALTYGDNIHSSTLCTAGVGGIGLCGGDTGGPLVIADHQVGVASFISDRGCDAGLPSGFTRVSSFKEWISENSDIA